MSGYLHPSYAASLAEFGIPQELPQCGGWILKRQIPGLNDFDSMGCYPLFNCKDWSTLAVDLKNLGNELVSLSLVADPFGNYDFSILQSCFKDLLIPFKEHFVIRLGEPLESFVSEHHQRNARKALQVIQVERCEHPEHWIDDWMVLYNRLIQKHNIRGVSAFSKTSFLQQLKVPGIVGFRAIYESVTVGITLWYVWQDIGYYHLGAYSDLGYELRASFALFWFAIDYFAAYGLNWLNLGAGAGTGGNGSEGLSRFKRGWATETRTAYFCGQILNPSKYSEIVRLKNTSATNYFPAYRRGEFK